MEIFNKEMRRLGQVELARHLYILKREKRKTKAYLYIFYTAFIGSAIEVCIKKKFVHFVFYFVLVTFFFFFFFFFF